MCDFTDNGLILFKGKRNAINSKPIVISNFFKTCFLRFQQGEGIL